MTLTSRNLLLGVVAVYAGFAHGHDASSAPEPVLPARPFFSCVTVHSGRPPVPVTGDSKVLVGQIGDRLVLCPLIGSGAIKAGVDGAQNAQSVVFSKLVSAVDGGVGNRLDVSPSFDSGKSVLSDTSSPQVVNTASSNGGYSLNVTQSVELGKAVLRPFLMPLANGSVAMKLKQAADSELLRCNKIAVNGRLPSLNDVLACSRAAYVKISECSRYGMCIDGSGWREMFIDQAGFKTTADVRVPFVREYISRAEIDRQRIESGLGAAGVLTFVQPGDGVYQCGIRSVKLMTRGILAIEASLTNTGGLECARKR